jgi:hypothetical protein
VAFITGILSLQLWLNDKTSFIISKCEIKCIGWMFIMFVCKRKTLNKLVVPYESARDHWHERRLKKGAWYVAFF